MVSGNAPWHDRRKRMGLRLGRHAFRQHAVLDLAICAETRLRAAAAMAAQTANCRRREQSGGWRCSGMLVLVHVPCCQSQAWLQTSELDAKRPASVSTSAPAAAELPPFTLINKTDRSVLVAVYEQSADNVVKMIRVCGVCALFDVFLCLVLQCELTPRAQSDEIPFGQVLVVPRKANSYVRCLVPFFACPFTRGVWLRRSLPCCPPRPLAYCCR